MPQQNTSGTKEKILLIIKQRGPSLPVHIARETGMSMLFSSAFLAELLSEKSLRTSHMKVGGSPLYLIPGQESMLEKFASFLKSKEKDAFQILQKKKFVKDRDQTPAIRVALRSIKDFAFPFKPSDSEEVHWRYFIIPEEEFQSKPSKSQQVKKPMLKTRTLGVGERLHEGRKDIGRVGSRVGGAPERPIEIFDKNPEPRAQSRGTKAAGGASKPKAHEKFFNKIKDALAEKGYEIEDIISFSKNEIALSVKRKNQENETLLAVAYNKRTISENDISNAYRKASRFGTGTKYLIFFNGEPTRKMKNTIDAIKSLEALEKLK